VRRVNLVPLAGAGRRFVEAGYALPKPLIPVDGVPMILRAAAALPPADRWIFVCRAEHLREAHLEATLRGVYPAAVIIGLDEPTEGQACTCLVAADRLDDEDRLTIGACDNRMDYDPAALDRRWAEGADAVVWTFRHHPAVEVHPESYGWVRCAEDGRVRGVSCKVPISNTPMRDHAVIGAFSFRRAADFVRVARRTIALDRRVNGEFYLDTVMDQAAADGLDVRVLDVDRYVCWGTPADLEAAARS
jgi:NDP-sugar pyrophosphorylase family protein